MTQGAVVVPLRTLAIAGAALVVAIVLVALLVLPGPRDAILRLTDPRTTAAVSGVEQQRTATEHAVQRGYVKATAQLAQVRQLTLAIPAATAGQIGDKAVGDLRQIRHDALAAVGARLGLASPQLDQYVTAAESQLGDNAFADDRPVLLAPDLYTIVSRADELFQRTSDAAVRELTRSPSATPAATPSASPASTPRPSATPSASPTR